MLIGDSLLYLLVALYVEGVWPGEFGLPRPWYFPCTVRQIRHRMPPSSCSLYV